MDHRRAEPKHPRTRTHRGSPLAAEPEEPAAVEPLEWVTARVPSGLVREIEAHAKRMGATRSDAIRECLAVGIETIRGRDGISRGRVDELLGAIENVRLVVELQGPSTLGTQRLLAHWATRDGTVKVSEDELLAEVERQGIRINTLESGLARVDERTKR
jgi:hypothetical protein